MYTHKLNMTKMQAWNAFQEYRKALGKSASPEDAAIMSAYKALSKSKTVIDLRETIKNGGVFDNGLPKLAISRADRTRCWCEVWGAGGVQFQSESWARANAADIVRLPNGTLPERSHRVWGEAIVPTIPPKYRPAPTMLSKYWILWEAVWEKVAPYDPMLLKPLGKYLYAVVAVWDLTPVERAVLGGKL